MRFDAHWHQMTIGNEKCPRCGETGQGLSFLADEDYEDVRTAEEDDE